MYVAAIQFGTNTKVLLCACTFKFVSLAVKIMNAKLWQIIAEATIQQYVCQNKNISFFFASFLLFLR